jgi:hypothetical protein
LERFALAPKVYYDIPIVSFILIFYGGTSLLCGERDTSVEDALYAFTRETDQASQKAREIRRLRSDALKLPKGSISFANLGTLSSFEDLGRLPESLIFLKRVN